MVQSAVRRNGAATFMIWFTAPEQTGTYVEKFRPVMDGVTWLGPEVTFTFNVTGAPVTTNPKAVKGVTSSATPTPFVKIPK
jgi:hypothetical protein